MTVSERARFADIRAALLADDYVDIAEAYAAIEAAAYAGDVQAMLLAAYAAGSGYGCVQDFARAVTWLTMAAVGGDVFARKQLDFVGDIAAATAARPTRLVNEDPRIGMVDGFLSAAECAWLIERAAPMQEAALVYDEQGRTLRNDERTNTAGAFKLTDFDLPLLLIRQRIANTLAIPVAHFERTSVFRYEVGQRFGPHADYIATAYTGEIRSNGQRPATFLVYLNDDFDGGETHFLALGKRFRGGVGDALFFYNLTADGLPNEATMHEGEPPTRGEKWLLSQFIRDKDRLPG